MNSSIHTINLQEDAEISNKQSDVGSKANGSRLSCSSSALLMNHSSA